MQSYKDWKFGRDDIMSHDNLLQVRPEKKYLSLFKYQFQFYLGF